jgi:hypothetical protein
MTNYQQKTLFLLSLIKKPIRKGWLFLWLEKKKLAKRPKF